MTEMRGKSHKGEKPSFAYFYGLNEIKVELISATPDPERVIYGMVMATWHSHPVAPFIGSPEQDAIVEKALEGGALGTCLETINYTFTIEGITRQTTHQLVRTRIGAGMNQESLRAVDCRHHHFRIPMTFVNYANDKAHGFCNRVMEYVEEGRRLYAEAVDAGIPYQDARLLANIGTVTYLTETINYRALQGLLWARLCRNVDWEIREVARQMREEVARVHPLLGKYLRCSCEKLKKCTYRGELFPPCGDHPVPEGAELQEPEFSREMNGSNIERR